MLKTLLSTLALATALTSAALAGPGIPTATTPADLERPESARITTGARMAPIELTEAQLDTITAGTGAKGSVGDSDRVTALRGRNGSLGAGGNDYTATVIGQEIPSLTGAKVGGGVD